MLQADTAVDASEESVLEDILSLGVRESLSSKLIYGHALRLGRTGTPEFVRNVIW